MKLELIFTWIICMLLIAALYVVMPGFGILSLPSPWNYIVTGSFVALTVVCLGILFKP